MPKDPDIKDKQVTARRKKVEKRQGKSRVEPEKLACSPFLGPLIMGVICSLIHWTRDGAGLYQ
jgi:hypothetical protein